MKLHSLLASAAVLFAAVGIVVAQGPQRQGRGAGEGRGAGSGRGVGQRGGDRAETRPPTPLLRTLDKNGDGQLSKVEIEAAVAALKTLDRDGDGTLSQTEIGWPPQRGGAPGGFGSGLGRPQGGEGTPGGFGGGQGRSQGGGMTARMLQNDKNNDGKLSRDEMPEFMRGMFERWGSNSDGSVDKSELDAMGSRFNRGGARGRTGRR